jgi:hypothetical protein
MARSNSTTIVRAFNADGYHKDILIIDHDQVRMHDVRLKDKVHLSGGPIGPSMTIRPADFPEMVEFQILVHEFPPR